MYYDGTRLLSMKDINGNVPEIFICTSNRTAGKTTYFSRMLVNRFKNNKGKFMLIYRFSYELKECADKFFKDIRELFFPNDVMTAKTHARGVFYEMFLNDVSCGYAVALNNADQVKKYSHFFNDVTSMLFDEFQSETSHYCPNEVKKLISIHTSVARGHSKQVRYVPIYMMSNPVSILNPYYIEMGISNRITKETKFLKGDGFVLEQNNNETAKKAQKESGFNKAFSSNSYIAYSAENTYLNDNTAFVDKMSGNGKYLATIRYNERDYGIREFREEGTIYCDDRPDITFPLRISVTTADHNINYVMLRNNDGFLVQLRYYFEKGCFRFKNLNCKEAILKALSY